MFPNLSLGCFSQVGNAAGTGALLALISTSQRAKAAEIALCDGFDDLHIKQAHFGHLKRRS
ncbi:MAG: hypothetical protein L6461_02405 [Anaerolineae bacterium]|nr:hypothetical protein [Anaerolineae bacterium]